MMLYGFGNKLKYFKYKIKTQELFPEFFYEVRISFNVKTKSY